MVLGSNLAPDLWLQRLSVCLSVCASGSGSKKERQVSEVLTLMLQALQSISSSETLPASRVLVSPATTLVQVDPIRGGGD